MGAGLALVLVHALLARRQKARSRVLASRLSLLSQACAAAANGMLITDVEGTILWVNPAFTALTGYGEAEVLGRKPNLLKSGRHPEAFYAGMWRSLLDGEIWHGELENRRRDGSIYLEEQTITPVRDAAGRVRHFIAIKQDVTARRRLETELDVRNRQSARELEARNHRLAAVTRDLEMFAYAVSHDLRAPLRAIDFFGHELIDVTRGTLEEAAQAHLDRILAARRRMAQMIDSLMALFHLGRGELRPAELDLSRLAETTAEELRKAHPGRAVEVTIQPGLKATGDARLVQSILVNLLGNAWKFTGRKPGATVEVGALDVDGVRAFFVRDNGVGFNMTYADRLFTAIRRLHTQDEFEGNGIGLVCVHRAVERHQGRVWVEAAEGRGATFYFTLAPGSGSASNPPAAVAATPSASPGTAPTSVGTALPAAVSARLPGA